MLALSGALIILDNFNNGLADAENHVSSEEKKLIQW